jgi:hypothetical protein
MSGLLDALHRLEGRARVETTTATVAAPPTVAPPPKPAPAVTPSPLEVERFAPFLDALASACPPPALIAFLTVGVEGSITPLLRDHADAVARRLGRDVALLGPGVLDETTSKTSGWTALRERAAYGFLHATADFALARPTALQQVAAVVPVVELGKSSTQAVASLRRLLALQRITVLGAVVVSD